MGKQNAVMPAVVSPHAAKTPAITHPISGRRTEGFSSLFTAAASSLMFQGGKPPVHGPQDLRCFGSRLRLCGGKGSEIAIHEHARRDADKHHNRILIFPYNGQIFFKGFAHNLTFSEAARRAERPFPAVLDYRRYAPVPAPGRSRPCRPPSCPASRLRNDRSRRGTFPRCQ